MALERAAVVVDPAFVGDVVFDGPLVRALVAEGFTRVGIVVRPPADAVARRLRGVDRVHVFDKRGRDRGLGGLRRLAAELAQADYALAVVPHPSVRSSLLVWLAGVPSRVGDAGPPASWFLSRRVQGTGGAGFVERRLALLGEAAADVGLAGCLRATPHSASGRVRIGLALGSAWETKRWPAARAAELARALDPERVQLVWIGAPWERELFDAVGALDPGPAWSAAEDALHPSLETMIDTIASCAVLVAGDTGPLHLARALGVPVAALFGPTDEALHHFGARDRVLTVSIDCRPCSPHGHRRCPLGHHRCLDTLGGDRVASSLGPILEGSA